MEILKVGDKVVKVSCHPWSNDKYYNFSTVVRTTKTQAILENGTKLINEISHDYSKNIVFREYGNRYDYYSIVTDELIKESKDEKLRQYINIWFFEKKFTEKEKFIIYNNFKELNIL